MTEPLATERDATPGITPDYALRMARYNRWMNRRLYAQAATLDDGRRREDRGAYFKSLQGTLAHLVQTDRIWLNRFSGRSPSGYVDGEPPVADDFAALTAQRDALDEAILGWAAALDPAWLGGDLRYYSNAYASWYARPAWQLVTHFFNHQTHHRGQATTLLMQFGIDPGVTDLPLLPDAG